MRETLYFNKINDRVIFTILLQHRSLHLVSSSLCFEQISLFQNVYITIRYLELFYQKLNFRTHIRLDRVQTTRSTAFFNRCPYVFLKYYYITIYKCKFVYHIIMTSPLWLAVGPQFLTESDIFRLLLILSDMTY